MWTYTYDPENRLTSATDGLTTVTYEYDPLGRRSAKVVGGVRTEYLSSGAHEIIEYDGAGGIKAGYVFGPGIDNPVMMIEGADWSLNDMRTFYRQDALGTIIATTDSAGALREKYTYSAYGKPDSAGGQSLRYTGRRWDAETGLYYYRNRYYSPAIGRFLQTDPIGYADNLNLYAYVGNDPMNATDPSGLAGCDLQCPDVLPNTPVTPPSQPGGPAGPEEQEKVTATQFETCIGTLGLSGCEPSPFEGSQIQNDIFNGSSYSGATVTIINRLNESFENIRKIVIADASQSDPEIPPCNGLVITGPCVLPSGTLVIDGRVVDSNGENPADSINLPVVACKLIFIATGSIPFLNAAELASLGFTTNAVLIGQNASGAVATGLGLVCGKG